MKGVKDASINWLKIVEFTQQFNRTLSIFGKRSIFNKRMKPRDWRAEGAVELRFEEKIGASLWWILTSDRWELLAT